MFYKTCTVFLRLALVVGSIQSAFAQANAEIKSLRFLDEYVIAHDATFQRTSIGGISGIDYDFNTLQYFMLSDDRSSSDSARFYTANIILKNNKIDSIIFTNVVYLRQPNGLRYPSRRTDPGVAPDPESIRFNPKTNELIWTNEGERWYDDGKQYFIDPTIHAVKTDGVFVNEFILTDNLKLSTREEGPRRNGALEAASFGKDFQRLYVAMEEPLYEDGQRITHTSNDSFVRIFLIDINTRKSIAQYAYQPERVAYASSPREGFQVNGISEILEVGPDQLLVIERSFSTGRKPCTVKLFLADLANSDDVSAIKSLKEKPPTRPIKKKLLLNMDDLGISIDNIEGVTWGPILENRHRSLFFVTDNNFAETQKTQVLLFEVSE